MKLYNKFTESVSPIDSFVNIIEDKNSKNILEGDNFSLSKNLKFPEIEDLDMYLQLIEDDGGEYDISDHLIVDENIVFSSKFIRDVQYIIDYRYVRLIDVYDNESSDFVEEFKNKYSKSDVWDIYIQGNDDTSNSIEIRFVSKEILDIKEIIVQFNKDIEKFLNDNRDIIEGSLSFGNSKAFRFGAIITDCKCSNLSILKNRIELFLDSHKYYVGVVLNRNGRMTFTISLSLN